MERKTRAEDDVKLLSRGSRGNHRHGIEINQRDITLVIHTYIHTCKHRLFCIFFRSDEAVDESLSTTLPSSEVKIRTKRDISLTIHSSSSGLHFQPPEPIPLPLDLPHPNRLQPSASRPCRGRLLNTRGQWIGQHL